MEIKILPQPDDVTCGPTSLHAVYSHLGYKIPLKKLISEIEFLEEGGTLGVFLGIDALKRGFKATIYSYNLKLFDPTWSNLKMPELREKLVKLHRRARAPSPRLISGFVVPPSTSISKWITPDSNLGTRYIVDAQPWIMYFSAFSEASIPLCARARSSRYFHLSS